LTPIRLGPSRSGGLRRDAFEFPFVEWDPDGAPVEPPILLLHGLSSNARYWDRVASRLTTRRVVALDLTPTDPDDAGMADFVADIATAISDLRLEKPVLAGHSWGAGLALEFAAARPELVSGLVFVDGPVTGVARIFSWEEVEAFMQPPFKRYASVAEAAADSRAHLGDAWGDDLRPYVEGGLTRDAGGFTAKLTSPVRLRILRDLHDSEPESLWPRISVPAAALIARKHDARIASSTEAGIARIEEIAPQVAIRRFATPHDIPLYAPSEVAREIELVAARAGAENAG
jgi:pimeloyl-ACP methyl ester carboxylesterase